MTPDPYSTDGADLQADEPVAHPAAARRSRTKQWVAAAAVAGALLGTTGVAMAQTDSSSASDSSTTATAPDPQAAPDQVDRSQAVHPGEELLTGDTADQVSAAAKAAVSDATIDRVETDAEGSPYEAHMTKSDGTHVTVKVDESFTVTSVEQDQGGPGHGPQGAPPAQPGSSTSASTSA